MCITGEELKAKLKLVNTTKSTSNQFKNFIFFIEYNYNVLIKLFDQRFNSEGKRRFRTEMRYDS